jgi:hypothetical protein
MHDSRQIQTSQLPFLGSWVADPRPLDYLKDSLFAEHAGCGPSPEALGSRAACHESPAKYGRITELALDNPPCYDMACARAMPPKRADDDHDQRRCAPDGQELSGVGGLCQATNSRRGGT